MSVRSSTTALASLARLAVMAAAIGASIPAIAQQYDEDADPAMRVERLENRLRQLTGQNEELQHRNQVLEQQLRQLQGGVAPGQAAVAAPTNAAIPSVQPNPPGGYGSGQPPYSPVYERPQPTYANQQPAPIVQEPAPVQAQGDAFDPNRNPNAPGAPRALGGGQLPITHDGAIGAPGGRGAGEPLNLSNVGGASPSAPVVQSGNGDSLTTAPPSQTPKDEFDLGIGYMQRKDYALAEETMRNFTRRYPNNPQVADAQYWLGESFFQRQKYRDAAESFLAVTSKYDTSAKAPDALLRLGQSLAALKEKEAACAALGEVTRKYPRASRGVKQAVDREQKRVKC